MKKSLCCLLLTLLHTTASAFTFLVASDPLIGDNQQTNCEAANKATLTDMNDLTDIELPCLSEEPPEKVEKPKGLLLCGNLTTGSALNWTGYWFRRWHTGFDHLFKVDGRNMLRYPVYEGYGEVDHQHPKILYNLLLRNRLRESPLYLSENGLHYSWNWEGIHFVNLNLYPGRKESCRGSLDFLRDDLSRNLERADQPIIIYHYYPYKNSDSKWSKREKEAAFKIMKGKNIIAIFATGTENKKHRWNGLDIYNVATMRKEMNYFVCHIKDDELIIDRRKNGQWDGRWQKSYQPHVSGEEHASICRSSIKRSAPTTNARGSASQSEHLEKMDQSRSTNNRCRSSSHRNRGEHRPGQRRLLHRSHS